MCVVNGDVGGGAVAKFRKKPVVIEAMQWVGTNQFELMRWAGEVTSFGRAEWQFKGNSIFIHTLEGVMEAALGDWIICGVKGEFYPCKPDIFESTYEAVK